VKVRAYIKKRYGRSALPRSEFERTREKVVVFIFSLRVGMIIGKKGQEVETDQGAERLDSARDSRSRRSRSTAPRWTPSSWPRTSASSWRNGRASAHHEAHMDQTMEGGAKASASSWPAARRWEMARNEKPMEGSIPLSTCGPKIDYGFCEAKDAQAISASRCGSTTVIFSTREQHRFRQFPGDEGATRPGKSKVARGMCGIGLPGRPTMRKAGESCR